MRKFEFKNQEEVKLLTLTIDGKEYSFNPFSLEVKKASEKYVVCQEPLINNLKKENLSNDELSKIVIASCELVKNTINAVVGKGTYERIFDGRTVNFEEHQELMAFVFDEITEFSKGLVQTNEHNPKHTA